MRRLRELVPAASWQTLLKLGVLVAMGLPVAVQAAPPPNDNFANAFVVSGTFGTTNGTNVQATQEPGEPNHVGLSLGNSVWYTWTAPSDGLVAVHTLGSDYDTLLAVYAGTSLNSLEPIGGNDDFDPNVYGPSGVKFTAKAGTVYAFAVDGFQGDTGNIVLSWAYSAAGIFQFAGLAPDDAYHVSETESSPPRDIPTARHTLRGARITVTRLFGTHGRVLVDYATSDGTAVAGTDYLDSQGTLVFEDYEMSKSFLIPIGRDFFEPAPSRDFTVTLSNARLAPEEDAGAIAPPLISNLLGEVPVIIHDCDGEDPDEERPNAIINLEKRFFRVPEGIGSAVIYARRTGTNVDGVKINYTINSRAPFQLNQQENGFALNAGSDYATPTPPEDPPQGLSSDYVVASGELTWGQNDFDSQPIIIPIVDDGLVEFNEDLQIQIYRVPGSSDKVEAGENAFGILTILYDEMPAGAVDMNHNPDYNVNTVPSYNPHPGANSTVYSVALQADGRAVIGGTFTAVNTVPRSFVARLNADGSLDTGFDPGSGANDFVSSVAIESGGKILLGGGFSAINGESRRGIARLNSGGSVDTTFNPGQGVDGVVWSVATQADGKVVIAGEFTSIQNQSITNVARLNSDGSLDTTFNPGVGPNGIVNAVAVQADGKVVIGGEFTAVSGAPRHGIARLDVDGTVDATFNAGTGTDGPVYAVTMAGAKVYIGGAFYLVDGRDRRNLARLNGDGSLDETFEIGLGANDTVYSIALSGGNVVIGGVFTSYNETRRVGVARLLSTGALDTSFMDTAYNQFAGLIKPLANEQVNPKRAAFSLAVQQDGAVLVGGSFEQVGGGYLNTAIQTNNAANGDRESLTRAGIRHRSNIARLLGGSTIGPGNIEFTYDNYTADENGVSLYIAMQRVNGSLGPISANFTTPPLPPGPGAATIGADFLGNGSSPAYAVTWPLTRMRSDGIFGPNNVSQTVIPNMFIDDVRDDVFVDVLQDSIIEGNETVNLRLSAPNGTDVFLLGGENIPLGMALGKAAATMTIVDDDKKPGVLGFNAAAFTVNEDGGSATITVTRTNGSEGTVQVQYSTVLGGTATANTDYSPRNNTLTFFEGQLTKTFTVPIVNDGNIEPDETIFVRLFNAGGGATLGLTNAVLTIIDNDFTPGHLVFNPATYATNENGGFALVSVSRIGGSATSLSVSAVTTDGTASAGSDYVAATNVLSWSNGDITAKTFAIALLNDGVVEPDETFGVFLRNPIVNGTNNNQALGTPTNTTVTLINDDFRGQVQFSTPAFAINENGGSAYITAVRVGGSAEGLSVNFSATAGTAVPGVDFTATNGTFSFGPGEVSRTFTVPVTDNAFQDGTRFVTLTLANALPAGTLGSPSTAILNILDDESTTEPPGGLDTSYTAFGMNEAVHALALQSDGMLLAAGDFTQVNHLARNRIARLDVNGGLDTKFSSTAPTAGANAIIRALKVQTDGRILVGGDFTMFNGVNRSRLSRLNFDGSVDETFNPGSGADNPVFAVAESFVGTNRVVLVGGGFTSINLAPRNGFARLDDNGLVDGSFNPGGAGANGIVYAIAVQTDGKIVIGGDFTAVNGVGRNRLARLNANGTLDHTFDPGSGADGAVRALAIQLDGRILIGGSFTNYHGTALSRVARVNLDGSVDGSFDAGPGANDTVSSITLQPDTRIVLGGLFTRCNGVSRNHITRLNNDGSADTGINFGAGANNFVAATVVQTDARIVLGGGFTEYDGTPRQRLARIYGGSIAGSGSFEFTSANYSVAENGTNVTLTVRRRGGTAGQPGDITVDVSTSDQTATNGLHYTGGTTPLSFPPGEVFQSLVISVADDFEVNPNRTVGVALGNIQPQPSAAIGNQPTATLTIVNDDSGISFDEPTFTVNENQAGGVAVVDVRRFGSLLGTVTVEFTTTTNGSATAGNDYTSVSNTITFLPGETLQSVLIPIANDTLVEGDETVGLQLSSAGGALLLAPATAALAIVDDDFAPGRIALSAPAYAIAENGGFATINVIRTNGRTGVVSARLFTSDVTANAGLDYTAVDVAVVFGDGETNKTVIIPISDEALVEGPEQFTLSLTNATGGATIIDPMNAPVTIVDNDVGITLSSPVYLVNESGSTITVTALRINGSNGVATVNYTTADSTATAGADYTTTSGTLTFANGETIKSFTIPVLEDSLVEGDETFNVALSNPSAGVVLVNHTALVTVIDNDTGLGFAPAGYVVDESGTNVLLTVVRTNSGTGTISVSYGTTNGTATAGDDYIGTAGVLTFTNGESLKTITVPITDDTQVEGDEAFTVALSNPTGGAQFTGPTVASVSIIDNDAGIALSSANYSILEGGVQATVTVVRTGITNSLVSVNYSTADGTATNGADYLPVSGTLTFTNTETVKTFTVAVIDDTIEEGSESVLLKLSNPVGQASLLSPNAATLTIVDNDGSLVLPAGALLTAESGPVNGAMDPGETISGLFAIRNVSGFDTANLVATLLVTNGVAGPSGPQNYGALASGGASVSRPFSFTANGTNGSIIAATFQLQDGLVNYGRVTFNFLLGTSSATFSNPAAITINDGTSSSPTGGTPYPSVIPVAGLGGSVSKVAVTLTNVAHTNPDDVDILLVGPAGQRMVLMSDAGGGNTITNVTLNFDDAAGPSLPDSASLASGTFKPSNYPLGISDSFPSPAPPAPYDALLATFNGSNPNGAWSLYVADDATLDVGSIVRGWSLNLTTSGTIPAAADLSVTMTGVPNPVVVGSNLVYTILVTNHGPWSANGVVLSNTLPLNAVYLGGSVSSGSLVTNAAGQAVWTLGSMAKDAFATATITVRPVLAGSISSTSMADAAEADPNVDNNLATVNTTVSNPTADLVMGLIGTPNPVYFGQNLLFSLFVTNEGPATAIGVSVTNTLPPGVTFLSATPSGYTLAGSVVTFTNLGNLGSGATVSATINVRPNVPATLTNTATAGSSVTDPLKGNNTATVKIIAEYPPLTTSVIGNNLVISWPAAAPGYNLESTTNLTPPVIWTPVTVPAPVVVGSQKTVTVGIGTGSRYFRLRATLP